MLRLHGDARRLEFDFEAKAAPAQYVLAAIYAAGEMETTVRPAVLDTVRKGLEWFGPVGPELIGHLSGKAGPGTWSAEAFDDPVGWAAGLLGLDEGCEVHDERSVQRRFRVLLRDAHPDHGAGAAGAAERIAELTAARRILLAAS